MGDKKEVWGGGGGRQEGEGGRQKGRGGQVAKLP